MITLYEFAKEHATIVDNNGNKRKFNDIELDEIKYYENLLCNESSLRMIHTRKCSKIIGIKKNDILPDFLKK